MTLHSSGLMSASMINTELGRSATAQFNIGGSAERASSSIAFSHFYGKQVWDGGRAFSWTAPTTIRPNGNSLYYALSLRLDIYGNGKVRKVWTGSTGSSHLEIGSWTSSAAVDTTEVRWSFVGGTTPSANGTDGASAGNISWPQNQWVKFGTLTKLHSGAIFSRGRG